MKKPYLEPELNVLCFLTEKIMLTDILSVPTGDESVDGEVEMPAV